MQKRTKLIVIAALLPAVFLGIAGAVVGLIVHEKNKEEVEEKTLIPTATVAPEISGKIESECPFELSDSAEWTYYPEDNMLGFAAVAKDEDENGKTDVLVFAHLEDAEVTEHMISHPDEISGAWEYGGFKIDKRKVVELDDYYYVKLDYDKRITVDSFTFSENWDLACVYLIDNMRVETIHYGGQTGRRVQYYDRTEGTWGDVTAEVDSGIDEVAIIQSAEKLDVDEESEPWSLYGDICFIVYEYRYSMEQHDVYGEVSEPQNVTLYFRFETENDAGLDAVNGFKFDAGKAKARLYIKSGERYTDITPKDFTVVQYAENYQTLFCSVESNLMGPLVEGDYRLEVGTYSADFRLTMQTYWIG